MRVSNKSVSLTQIARIVGVSHAAVSMVLNPSNKKLGIGEDSAKRIRQVAKKLGYVPNYHARAMKHGRSGVIGIILDVEGNDPYRAEDPGATQLGLPYFGTLVGAIELYSRSRGYFTTIVGPNEKLSAIERGHFSLLQRQFDGLIVPGAALRSLPIDFMKKSIREPIVMIDYPEATSLPTVEWDEEAGVAMAVKHLAELGHRKIIWLGPGVSAGPGSPFQREETFMLAVQDTGLHGESCRFFTAHSGYFGATVESASAALDQFIQEQRIDFTAVVAYNDVVAIGAYAALHKNGYRIPAEVSVVGFDNVIAALAVPSLTTISRKLFEIGSRASELLFEMIENHARIIKLQGKREVILPELIYRKSTAPYSKRTVKRERR